MKIIKDLLKNYKLIVNEVISYYTIVVSVLSFGIAITENEIKLANNCVIMVYVVLLLVIFVLTLIRFATNKKNTVYKRGNMSLNIIYDDLFDISLRNNRHNSIVVIPVNTAFDTIVDEKLQNIYKPLVSAGTLHGQWIKRVLDSGLTIDELNRRISTDLAERHICPIENLNSKQKPRGNTKCYERGTVAVIEHKNTTFFLFALSVFDENNNAQCNRDQFILAMQRLLLFCDNNSNGKDIYLPLMGTNLSRTNMNHEESLQSLVALCKLYEDKLHNAVNIVIYEGDRDKVSIYDAK